MKLRLTKTTKIVLGVSICVLSLALGFLIWRVNQQESISPEEGEAGIIVSGCSPDATEQFTSNCRVWFAEPGDESQCVVGNTSGCCGFNVADGCARCACCDGTDVIGNLSVGSCDDYWCANHGGTAPCEEEEEGCRCAGWDNGCGEDCNFPNRSEIEAEMRVKAERNCKSYIAMCVQGSGDIVIQEYTPSHICYGKVNECNNPYVPNPCTEPEPDPCGNGTIDPGEDCDPPGSTCPNGTVCSSSCTCGVVVEENECDGVGKGWMDWKQPSGEYNFDDDITFEAIAGDSDGVDKGSITATLCETNLSEVRNCYIIDNMVCNGTDGSQTISCSGTLSSSTNRLSPNDYELSFSWSDVLGATSSACSLTSTFSVLAEETNPNWDISKRVVEQCIDDNTENPIARLTYTITVENTGDASGNILKVVDDLDDKVLAVGLVPEDISPSEGAYSTGEITWDYSSSPEPVAASGSKTFTYTIDVDKDNFGVYSNIVTLSPEGSADIQASANIDADCTVVEPEEPEPEPEGPVPETGIFDSTIGRVIGGIVLVLFGVGIYRIPNKALMGKEKKPKFKYRDRFEKRVDKE